jgi:hypothetical protein
LKLDATNIKSYLPLVTVVGPGKTTSFSPGIAQIVQTFYDIFGQDIVVLFDFKRQKIGFVRESKKVKKELAMTYFRIQLLFKMLGKFKKLVKLIVPTRNLQ